MRALRRRRRDDAAAGEAVGDGGLGHEAGDALGGARRSWLRSSFESLRMSGLLNEGGDGAAAAGEIGGGGAGLLRRGHDRRQAPEDLGAGWLVDAVLRRLVEEVVAAGGP